MKNFSNLKIAQNGEAVAYNSFFHNKKGYKNTIKPISQHKNVFYNEDLNIYAKVSVNDIGQTYILEYIDVNTALSVCEKVKRDSNFLKLNKKAVSNKILGIVQDAKECNNDIRFLTYTVHLTDNKQAFQAFQNYIHYLVKNQLIKRYLYVVEFQKRGAIHFHMFASFFKKPSYKKLRDKWQYYLNETEIIHMRFDKVNLKDVDIVAKYISKYVSKQKSEQFNYFNIKSLSNSSQKIPLATVIITTSDFLKQNYNYMKQYFFASYENEFCYIIKLLSSVNSLLWSQLKTKVNQNIFIYPKENYHTLLNYI